MDDSFTASLKKAEIKLESVLNAISHDIIITDTDGRISYINLKAKSDLFAGYYNQSNNFADLLKILCEKYTVDDSKALMDLYIRAAKPESFLIERIRINVTKSVKKVYEVLTSPIYDPKLEHLGRIWQFNDITIQENINNLKSEFISVASHQLRTPLTSIRGYVAMILEGDYGKVSDTNLEPLKYIEKAGKEMANLIDDLLNVSRLEKHTDDSSIVDFNFDEIIDELKMMFNARLTEKNMAFVYTPFTKGMVTKSDKNKVRECVKNLIDNAIKYGKKDGKVVITTAQVDANKFRVDVTDDGIGIPEDQQDRIFEKFFRAANVLTENFDGTGLGLYYVKEVAERLGGSVTFKSKVGSGSTFTIILPINITLDAGHVL